MKNKLNDLNNYLFEQLERINDDELTDEELERQLKKAKTITDIADKVIRNGELALNTTKLAVEYGVVQKEDMPTMLLGTKKSNE